MNQSELIAEIAEKVADLTGTPLGDIGPTTRIYHDAGLSGDDLDDFIDWYAERFEVNLEGMKLSDFSPGESFSLWPWPLRRRYLALRIADLAIIAQNGSWAASGLQGNLPRI